VKDKFISLRVEQVLNLSSNLVLQSMDIIIFSVPNYKIFAVRFKKITKLFTWFYHSLFFLQVMYLSN
jgi:hypothetical protein